MVMTFLAKKLNQKTLKQQLQENASVDINHKWLYTDKTLETIKEWLTQKRCNVEIDNVHSTIGKIYRLAQIDDLLEELK